MALSPAKSITATLIVKRTPRTPGRRHAYLYSVEFDGLVVENSADAECDLARVLLARGISGVVTLIDGATGKPRSKVNIAKAALLTVREDRQRGLYLRKWRPPESAAGSSPTGERPSQVGGQPRWRCCVNGSAPAGTEALRIQPMRRVGRYVMT